MPHTIRISALRGYPRVVERLGGDPWLLMRKFGIKPEQLDAEEVRIPYRQFAYLLEETAEQLGRFDFGMILANEQDLSILGPLAVAMQNSRTVEEAERCASDYLYVQSPALHYSIDKGEDESVLRIKIKLTNMSHESITQAEDLAILFTHNQVRMLAGKNYRLLRVELPHAARCEEEVYFQYFNAPIAFSSFRNALTVTTETIESPLEESSRILQTLAASYLDTYDPHSDTPIKTRVELAIRRSLATDNCNRETIASAMAVHPRTLQRRLEEEGVNFNGILDQVRRDLAEYYLAQTELPFTQISFLLGYQEQAIFSRSCRRWFGAAPTAVRKSSKVKQ